MTILGCFGGTTILGNTHMEISIPSQWNRFGPFIPWTYPRVFHSFPAVLERFKVMFHFFAPSAIHSPVLIETDKLYHPQKMPFPLKGNNHLEQLLNWKPSVSRWWNKNCTVLKVRLFMFNRESHRRILKLQKTQISSWWLNQPIWKIWV